MTKSIRFIFLTALTYTVYGLYILADTGSIIFPFPLNDLLFLIAVFYFQFVSEKDIATAPTEVSFLNEDLIDETILNQNEENLIELNESEARSLNDQNNNAKLLDDDLIKGNSHFFIYLSLAICGLLRTELFWSFFLDSEQMLELSESTTTDWFSLLYYFTLLILICLLFISKPYSNNKTAALSLTILILITLIYFNLMFLWFIFFISIWFLLRQFKIRSKTMNLWLLLGILNLYMTLSFLLN